MSNYLVTDSELGTVASAIRTKGGTEDELVFPGGFVTAIQNIPTGGGNIFTATKTFTVDGGTDAYFGELSEEAYSHINDESAVLFIQRTSVGGGTLICFNTNKVVYSQNGNYKYGLVQTGSDRRNSAYGLGTATSANVVDGIYITTSKKIRLATQSSWSGYPLAGSTYNIVMTW